jgi:hypothetical protein
MSHLIYSFFLSLLSLLSCLIILTSFFVTVIYSSLSVRSHSHLYTSLPSTLLPVHYSPILPPIDAINSCRCAIGAQQMHTFSFLYNIVTSKVQFVLPVMLTYRGRRGISPLMRNLDTWPEALMIPADCLTPRCGRFGRSNFLAAVGNRNQSAAIDTACDTASLYRVIKMFVCTWWLHTESYMYCSKCPPPVSRYLLTLDSH